MDLKKNKEGYEIRNQIYWGWLEFGREWKMIFIFYIYFF